VNPVSLDEGLLILTIRRQLSLSNPSGLTRQSYHRTSSNRQASFGPSHDIETHRVNASPAENWRSELNRGNDCHLAALGGVNSVVPAV